MIALGLRVVVVRVVVVVHVRGGQMGWDGNNKCVPVPVRL